MAVEQLSFQGINRAASDFSNGGACEEMINLRPTGTGLVPVKPFSVKMHGVAYDKLYIHKAGAVTNYIAIKLDNGTLYIYHVSEDGIVLATIATVDVTGKANFSVDHVHFAYTGNIILFSICDKADNFYKNLSFLWDSTAYKLQEADVPELLLRLVPDTTPQTGIIDPQDVDTTNEFTVEACQDGVNETVERYKDGCFGYFIVAAVFKTKDGKTIMTSTWKFFDPVPALKSSQLYTNRFDANGHYLNLAINNPGGENYAINLIGLKVNVQLSLLSSINTETSQIKSVEIYASKQVPYVNVESIAPQVQEQTIWMADILEYKESELDNQLLYFQKSVPIGELIGRDTPYEFELTFGGSAQAAATTLEVDAGSVTRFGKMLAYNSRYHFFNSEKKVEINMPSFFSGYTSEVTQHDVFVVYNDGKRDITAYVGVEDLHTEGEEVVIAPFTNIKRVITQRPQSGSLYLATRQYEMEESQRYNYSICTNGGSLRAMSAITGAVTGPIYIDEPEAINVTEQYNPFVFKVEHSYLAPGAVLDIQPQMVAVKDVTYGDYPLNVFTNRGLYALLQGNGVVLYGAFRSISNLITTANAIPTEMGTFFLAADGMWLIAGDTVVLVSDALSRGPHKFVRDAPGYYDICHDTYDVTQYVSAVSFEEFTKETAFSSAARLVYNRYRDELMVCNPDYDYCYVLSLKYRQWFKLAETYSQDAVGEIAFSGFSVSGRVVSEDSPAPYHTITVSFTIGGNTFTCDHYVANNERNARAIADALTSDCREAFAGTVLSEISFVAALDASSNFHLSAILPKTIDDPQSVTASLFKIVNRAEETIFEGSFLFAIGRNVVSFEDEDELTHSILIHLQTRPFSIGYQYIHIHRIVAMIRARLASGHLIVNALYGSDDLQNWTLISYASRQNAHISQIRTPSAARSWRYYTVCIGGHVHWDTDLGTVLFDYQPVVRRIG